MIPSLADINDAEAPHLDARGQPLLRRSLSLLRQRWDSGCRDRETALRLLFLCWYCRIEPPFVTGVEDVPQSDRLCLEAFEALGGAEASDAEVCFVVAQMAALCAWCLGDPGYWEAVGLTFRDRSVPSQLKREQFAGRGAYGEYFAHTLAAQASG